MTEDIRFSFDEVFRLAIRIEKAGAAFYLRAAAKVDDRQAQTLMIELAQQENRHEDAFTSKRTTLGTSQETTVIDPSQGEGSTLVADYLHTSLESEVFELHNAKAEQALEHGTAEDVLRVAMENELNAIGFYTMVLDLVREEETRDMVKQIVNEEFTHLSRLAALLEKRIRDK